MSDPSERDGPLEAPLSEVELHPPSGGPATERASSSANDDVGRDDKSRTACADESATKRVERRSRYTQRSARPLLSSPTQGLHGVAPRRPHPLQASEGTDHLLDINEAAAMLCIAPATLRNWAYQRRIAKVKLGGPRGALRFRVSDLQRFIRAGVQAPIGTRRVATTPEGAAS